MAMSANINNTSDIEINDALGLKDFILPNIPARLTQKGDLERFLLHMSENDGSDLFLMSNLPAWLSIQGRKRPVTERKLSHSEIVSLMCEAYDSPNAQTELGRVKPLNFSYEFRTEDKSRLRYRVNAVSCKRNGENAITLTFRSIPTTPPTVEQLGIEKEIIDICDKNDQGMILVVGATGNGKSTTLAAIQRRLLEDPNANRNLVDIGAPIEFVFDDIHKPTSFVTPIEIGVNLTSFSDAVINAMRMAPQIIQIGECRDYETIEAAVEASKTGHAVYSTLHANSAPQTLRRMVAMFPNDMQSMAQLDIVESTKLIIAQRLLPTVDGKRCAIREYLPIDAQVRDMLWRSDNIGRTAVEALSRYGRSMAEDIENRFREGKISQSVYERNLYNYEADMKVMQDA